VTRIKNAKTCFTVSTCTELDWSMSHRNHFAIRSQHRPREECKVVRWACMSVCLSVNKPGANGRVSYDSLTHS